VLVRLVSRELVQANLFGKFSVAVEQTLVIFSACHVGQVGSRSDDTWRPPTARSHLLVVPPPSLPRIGASQPQAPPATADADRPRRPHPTQRRKGGRGLLDGLRARTEAMAKSTRVATRAALASHVGILPGEEIAAEP
jgi:hypothetical protein